MGFSRFRAGVTVRTAVLFVTIVAIAEMMARTQWYMTITLCIAGAFVQTGMLVRFATQSSREVARFLDAVSFDDISQSFSGLLGDNAHRELGAAMTRVLNLLRTGRAEREEQAGEDQRVGVDGPFELTLTRAEAPARLGDSLHGHVKDRVVDDDGEQPDDQHAENHPATTVDALRIHVSLSRIT